MRIKFHPSVAQCRHGVAAAVLMLGAALHPSARAQDAIWLGGEGFWDDATKWSGGVLPTGSSDVYVDANDNILSTVYVRSTALMPSADIGRLFVGNVDAVEVRSDLDVWGGLVNNLGRIHVGGGSSSSTSRLRLFADTEITGAGEIVLGPNLSGSNFGAIVASNVPDLRLQIGPDSIIRGAGSFTSQGSGSLTVLNRGLVLAEGDQGIVIAGQANFDNSVGRIQVADGSHLSTAYVATRVSGGTVESLGYATLGPYNTGSGTITGVTLVGNFGARSQRLEDITVLDRLETTASGGSTVISGQWQVLGDLVVNGGERASINGGLSLGGDGTTWMVKSSAGERADLIGHGTLAVEAGHTLRGSGRLESDEHVNKGLIHAENGVLDVHTLAGAFDNTVGVLRAAHDGTMAFYSNVDVLMSDASTIVVDVAGYTPGSEFGLFTTLDGDIVLDGQVHFAFGSFAASVGDEFTFFLHDHRVFGNGQFDGITNDRGYQMELRYNTTSVTAVVQAVPEPATWALWLAGVVTTGAMARRGRRWHAIDNKRPTA